MKIKNKISIFFSLIVVFLLVTFSTIIYLFSSNYREEQFYERLKDKAKTTANLLFEVEQVDSVLLKIIDNANQTILYKEKIVIYNSNFSKIYDSREELDILINKNDVQQISEEDSKRFKVNGFEILGITVIEKGQKYYVIASAYDKYGYSKNENLLRIIIVSLLISILFILITGRTFAKKLLMPVKNIISQMEDYNILDIKHIQYKTNSQDEIYQLVFSFNNMLDRLDGAMRIQKEFVSNASHELRTPLTSLRGQIDVALLKERSNEEYQSTLSSIKDDISNFIDLANKLLMLAQTDAKLPTFSVSLLRVDEIMWQAKQELSKINPLGIVNIKFQTEIDDEEFLKYYGSEILLKTAFQNLLDNSCKYSNDNTVDVIIESFKEKINIKFINNETQLTHDDVQKLFIPFYRASNSTGIEGHGVGLPLVKNIVEAHLGTVSINLIEKEQIEIVLVFNKKMNDTLIPRTI